MQQQAGRMSGVNDKPVFSWKSFTYKHTLCHTESSHNFFRVAGVRLVGTAREALLPVTVTTWAASKRGRVDDEGMQYMLGIKQGHRGWRESVKQSETEGTIQKRKEKMWYDRVKPLARVWKTGAKKEIRKRAAGWAKERKIKKSVCFHEVRCKYNNSTNTRRIQFLKSQTNMPKQSGWELNHFCMYTPQSDPHRARHSALARQFPSLGFDHLKLKETSWRVLERDPHIFRPQRDAN